LVVFKTKTVPIATKAKREKRGERFLISKKNSRGEEKFGEKKKGSGHAETPPLWTVHVIGRSRFAKERRDEPASPSQKN